MQNIEALIKAQEATILRLERVAKQADANLTAEQVELNYHVVKAAFAGMVGDIPVKVGDYVTSTTKLTTLTQNKPLEVYVSVPAERGRNLHMHMNIELLDEQGQSYGGSKVFFIAPNVDEASQSILVKSCFGNEKGLLRADQLVRAKLTWAEHNGTLVPTSAVSHTGGQDFVFVAQVDSSKKLLARQIPVKLGDIQGNNYQVISGIRPGQRIVVSGIQDLADNMPITEQLTEQPLTQTQ
jgi:RND family efflux transporter MFP subunit